MRPKTYFSKMNLGGKVLVIFLIFVGVAQIGVALWLDGRIEFTRLLVAAFPAAIGLLMFQRYRPRDYGPD
jgi:hypothetical protein